MSKVKRSEVWFTLSRPLTWAEREAFAEYVTEEPGLLGHRFHGPTKVVIHSSDDSRYVGEEIHTFIGTQFVNVYLKAIKTTFPKVRV